MQQTKRFAPENTHKAKSKFELFKQPKNLYRVSAFAI